MSSFVKVATRAELPVGGKKLVEIDGRAIAVFNIDGAFHAIDDVCTHDGGPLAEGELIGCEIECPRHGARFDVRTGRPLHAGDRAGGRSRDRVARRRYLRRDRRLTNSNRQRLLASSSFSSTVRVIRRKSFRPQGLCDD